MAQMQHSLVHTVTSNTNKLLGGGLAANMQIVSSCVDHTIGFRRMRSWACTRGRQRFVMVMASPQHCI